MEYAPEKPEIVDVALDSTMSEEEVFFMTRALLVEQSGGITESDALLWDKANGARFEELMQNPESNFIERLANERTRKEALEELKRELYQ